MDRERKKEIKKRPKKTEIDVDRAYGDAPEALCSVSAFFEPQQAGRQAGISVTAICTIYCTEFYRHRDLCCNHDMLHPVWW